MNDRKFVIAVSKQSALGIARKVRDGELEKRLYVFDTFREAYKSRKFRYRPAEWERHKIFSLVFHDTTIHAEVTK